MSAAALTATAGCARAADRNLTVYKTPACGCCKGWITHMTRAGYIVTAVELPDLEPVRRKHGVPFALSSCHTGLVSGYVVEGHVPPGDVDRLLQERPSAIGLTVPGMPLGSPGMETPDGTRERFQTLLLLDREGRSRPFATHG